MGWSGGNFTRSNGTFSGATVWAQDRDAGTLITAGNHDTHDEDLADGIDACLTKDGANSPSAHLQWIKSNYWGGTSAGSANAQTVTLSPAPTTYYAGMEIKFIPGNANTGSVTLNPNSLGAKTIKQPNGQNLPSSMLSTNAVICVIYDGTNFVLVSDQTDIYNTAETATNKRWSGAIVYRKNVSTGTLPNTTTSSTAHGLTFANIISIQGWATNGSSWRPLPYVDTTTASLIEVKADATNVDITTAADYSAYTTSYIVLEYVK